MATRPIRPGPGTPSISVARAMMILRLSITELPFRHSGSSMPGSSFSQRLRPPIRLQLRLELGDVVAQDNEVVLGAVAVLDVVAQQRLAAKAHAFEHFDGALLV